MYVVDLVEMLVPALQIWVLVTYCDAEDVAWIGMLCVRLGVMWVW